MAQPRDRAAWATGLAALVAGLFAGSALITLIDLFYYAQVPGENTIGEAGKVYFARRFAEGSSLFARAAEPPHYPSFHGPLFHLMFGVLGRLFRWDTMDYLFAGRAASLGLVGSATLLAGYLGRCLTPGRLAPALAAMVFLSAFSIHFVTASFRPDPWIAAIGIALCASYLRFGATAWFLAIALVAPSVSFFIKPTGFACAGGVFLALMADRRWKAAVLYGGGAWATLGASVLAVHFLSDGAYLDSLSDGVSVEYSARIALAALSEPTVWTVLAAPIALGLLWRSAASEHRRAALVVAAFWLASGGAAALVSARHGSDSYYYLEAFAYASVFFAAGFERLRNLRTGKIRIPGLIALTTAALIGQIPSWQRLATNPLAGGEALEGYQFLHTERVRLVEMIRRNDATAFSDDPTLNLLLENPPILYARFQYDLETGGALPPGTLTAALVRHDHDFVVLLGPAVPDVWRANLSARAAEGFEQALTSAYTRLPMPVYLYEVYLPKAAAQEEGPPTSRSSGGG